MMEKILDITFSGFWQFVGMGMIFNAVAYLIVNGVLRMFSRFMRMLMVRKHGWPPIHLDADGDFNPNKE